MAAGFKEYVLGVFVFSIGVIALSNFTVQIANQANLHPTELSFLNKSAELQEDVRKLDNSRRNITTESVFTLPLVFAKGSIDFLNVVFDVLGVIPDLFQQLAYYLFPFEQKEFPYLHLMSGAITMIIVFKIVGAIVGRGGT